MNGQRIAIIGYSHWNGHLDGADHPDFTKNVISDVITGTASHNFFKQIADYFNSCTRDGSTSFANFWNKVLFFNYLPRCIGGPDARFRTGRPEDHRQAEKRLRSIFGTYKPQKAIVFSAKAWDSFFPRFDDQLEGFDTTGMGEVLRPDPCGIYKAGVHKVRAFGLRHPQGAPKAAL